MTSHATSTLPHMLCVSCPNLCLSGESWCKCVTVRSCEQLLHWRRDSPDRGDYPHCHTQWCQCVVVWISLVPFCSHGEGRPGTCILPVLSHHLCIHTVWLEILVGRYFGGLLKICHLAEFTLVIEPVFSHNDIHNKMANQMR